MVTGHNSSQPRQHLSQLIPNQEALPAEQLLAAIQGAKELAARFRQSTQPE
jgi:hypothetical protein